MANIDLSIIIPSRNSNRKTADIIKMISEELKDLTIEYIVTDINSADGSVLHSLNMIKDHDLSGCVIQSSGTVSSALNTGMYKARGQYITFVYPTRLYKNYLSAYFHAASANNADFVFAAPKGTINAVPQHLTGVDAALGLIRGTVTMDFTAVMFKRQFLIDHHLRFYEDCTFGYAEAFIYNALMYDPEIAYAEQAPERDTDNVLKKDSSAAGSNNCFERVDAMIRVRDTVYKCHKNDVVLISYFNYCKLPGVIMNCVDKLLLLGFSRSSVKKLIKTRHYDRFLEISGETPASLKKRLLLWKVMPRLYKPQQSTSGN